DDPKRIQDRVQRLWAFKRRTQDWTAPSAGCIFKNPSGTRGAGWLIERAGLKGYQIGQALISPVHANFILNRGAARAGDVLSIIEEARARVQRAFGVELELEVQVLPKQRGVP
ncbi:MAG: UDP-N-acetylenolpyruvoylglucosamine reductase, partial [Candidatus Omnitrophica bacterium]|nr:UDP-N-acetylenolpyruvoylglucosamine reductase [Candidatus Omnitrophota bacterium]